MQEISTEIGLSLVVIPYMVQTQAMLLLWLLNLLTQTVIQINNTAITGMSDTT